MKLRIWCVSCIEDSLKPLVKKWHLKRTPIKKSLDGDRTYSKDTDKCFEYFIEINTLEDLFALQKDLNKLTTGWDNELILSEWTIGKWKGEKYEIKEKGWGLQVYNDYME